MLLATAGSIEDGMPTTVSMGVRCFCDLYDYCQLEYQRFGQASAVKRIVRRHKVDLLLLQETK